MDGFEHRALLADVRSGNEAESTNQACAQIGNNIAVKVLAQQNVELLRPHHELHRRVVDNHVGRFNVRVFLRRGAEAFQEKSIERLH